MFSKTAFVKLSVWALLALSFFLVFKQVSSETTAPSTSASTSAPVVEHAADSSNGIYLAASEGAKAKPITSGNVLEGMYYSLDEPETALEVLPAWRYQRVVTLQSDTSSTEILGKVATFLGEIFFSMAGFIWSITLGFVEKALTNDFISKNAAMFNNGFVKIGSSFASTGAFFVAVVVALVSAGFAAVKGKFGKSVSIVMMLVIGLASMQFLMSNAKKDGELPKWSPVWMAESASTFVSTGTTSIVESLVGWSPISAENSVVRYQPQKDRGPSCYDYFARAYANYIELYSKNKNYVEIPEKGGLSPSSRESIAKTMSLVSSLWVSSYYSNFGAAQFGSTDASSYAACHQLERNRARTVANAEQSVLEYYSIAGGQFPSGTTLKNKDFDIQTARDTKNPFGGYRITPFLVYNDPEDGKKTSQTSVLAWYTCSGPNPAMIYEPFRFWWGTNGDQNPWTTKDNFKESKCSFWKRAATKYPEGSWTYISPTGLVFPNTPAENPTTGYPGADKDWPTEALNLSDTTDLGTQSNFGPFYTERASNPGGPWDEPGSLSTDYMNALNDTNRAPSDQELAQYSEQFKQLYINYWGSDHATNRVYHGFIALVGSAAYAAALIPMSIGAIGSQIGLAVLLLLLPVTIFLLIMEPTRNMGMRMLKLTAAFAVTKAILTLFLAMLILLTTLLLLFLSTGSVAATGSNNAQSASNPAFASFGDGANDNLLSPIAPIAALFVLNYLFKAIGLGSLLRPSTAALMPLSAAMKATGNDSASKKITGQAGKMSFNKSAKDAYSGYKNRRRQGMSKTASAIPHEQTAQAAHKAAQKRKEWADKRAATKQSELTDKNIPVLSPANAVAEKSLTDATPASRAQYLQALRNSTNPALGAGTNGMSPVTDQNGRVLGYTNGEEHPNGGLAVFGANGERLGALTQNPDGTTSFMSDDGLTQIDAVAGGAGFLTAATAAEMSQLGSTYAPPGASAATAELYASQAKNGYISALEGSSGSFYSLTPQEVEARTSALLSSMDPSGAMLTADSFEHSTLRSMPRLEAVPSQESFKEAFAQSGTAGLLLGPGATNTAMSQWAFDPHNLEVSMSSLNAANLLGEAQRAAIKTQAASMATQIGVSVDDAQHVLTTQALSAAGFADWSGNIVDWNNILQTPALQDLNQELSNKLSGIMGAGTTISMASMSAKLSDSTIDDTQREQILEAMDQVKDQVQNQVQTLISTNAPAYRQAASVAADILVDASINRASAVKLTGDLTKNYVPPATRIKQVVNVDHQVEAKILDKDYAAATTQLMNLVEKTRTDCTDFAKSVAAMEVSVDLDSPAVRENIPQALEIFATNTTAREQEVQQYLQSIAQDTQHLENELNKALRNVRENPGSVDPRYIDSVRQQVVDSVNHLNEQNAALYAERHDKLKDILSTPDTTRPRTGWS